MNRHQKPLIRRCPHGSVGAIIKNEKGQILLGYRATEPLGWAGPAGHLNFPEDGDAADEETARNAILREVQEEVCLAVKRTKLLWYGVLNNQCRRPKDSQEKYNQHEWWLFECEIEDLGALKVDPEVFTAWRWLDPGDMPHPPDPAWEMIFEKLGAHA